MRAEEKGLELLFSRDLKIPDSLEGDSLRLVQILTNLVSNAIKVHPEAERSGCHPAGSSNRSGAVELRR